MMNHVTDKDVLQDSITNLSITLKKMPPKRETPLEKASDRDQVDEVQRLLNNPLIDMDRSLRLAVERGFVEIVRLLLGHHKTDLSVFVSTVFTHGD